VGVQKLTISVRFSKAGRRFCPSGFFRGKRCPFTQLYPKKLFPKKERRQQRLSPVEHVDVGGLKEIGAGLRGRARSNQSFPGIQKLAAARPIAYLLLASPAMMPSYGGRWPMAPARSRARRRGKSGQGGPEAHQKQDGGVGEARQGRIRANRRRSVCRTASSMA
jgi:hypothetical protein